MNQIEEVIAGKYENHVLPFVWMKGESHSVIKKYIKKIYDCDIREICVESRPHPNFAGDQWWLDLAYIIQECKELGMKIWILDDSHFPTGIANGKVANYPQYKKEQLIQRTYDVVGPQKGISIRVDNILKKEDEFFGAVLIHDNQYVDITSQVQDNILYMNLEKAGVFKVVILSITTNTGFRDDYINMIDSNSCHILINEVYEKHYKHFKEEFGKTIMGFFSDEPGFMNEKGENGDSIIGKNMPLPWSKELEESWRAYYQDDYRIALSKLYTRKKENYLERFTYMDIVTKLYQKNFAKQIGEWCREHGVMHIGHVIEDKECHSRLGVGAGHFFRAISGQDMAGVDIVINQLVPGIDEGMHYYGRGEWDMKFFSYALAKLGSSSGHIDPLKKGRTVAEVFGAFGWHEGLKLMKWITDHFLVRGVNYFVPHAFSLSPFPDCDCPPHFYAHGNNHQFPYFGKLMRYINKVSTILSNGKPVHSVAILYHGEVEWCEESMKIQDPAAELTKNQVDFDFICCDVFDSASQYHMSINKEGLYINGIKYKCLIIPTSKYITKSVYNFIKEAKKNCFPIFFINDIPKIIVETGEEFENNVLGRVVLLSNLSSELKKLKLNEISISEYQPWLRFYHYQKDNSDYYMFFNEHSKDIIKTSIINLKGIQYDILNEIKRPFNEELILYPYESCVIVPTTINTVVEDEVESFDIKGDWKLSFKNHHTQSRYKFLDSITYLDDLNQKYGLQAGTYKYEITFYTNEIINGQLQIEDVYEVVQLYIDEKDMGVRICPPYHFSIGDLSKGNHKIVMEVLNTLDKGINDMFSISEVIEPSGVIGKVEIKYKKNKD